MRTRFFVLFFEIGAGAAILATALLTAHSTNASEFLPLGDLSVAGGPRVSGATGISADGSTVVGETASGFSFEAFRWTESTGMVALGGLSAEFSSSSAAGVSADGSVVVGVSRAGGFGEAFRWTAPTGMLGLGTIGNAGGSSSAQGVSADGSVVVGRSGIEAFRWTAPTGMLGLEQVPGATPSSQANAVSADGSVVVGRSSAPNENMTLREATRWTDGAGIESLVAGAGDPDFSRASEVSADGSVIVGTVGGSASEFKAFRWTEETGIEGLGGLPGSDFSVAGGVSADGSVIVGHGETGNDDTGFEDVVFIWTETSGMQNLADVLADQDTVVPEGWELFDAAAISADGLTIVGSGVNPEGFQEAWLARLDRLPGEIPLPPALWLFGSAIAAAFAFSKRRARRPTEGQAHSTVTLFARFRGWSTSRSSASAAW